MKTTRILATVFGGVVVFVCVLVTTIQPFYISTEMSLSYGNGIAIGIFMLLWGLDNG